MVRLNKMDPENNYVIDYTPGWLVIAQLWLACWAGIGVLAGIVTLLQFTESTQIPTVNLSLFLTWAIVLTLTATTVSRSLHTYTSSAFMAAELFNGFFAAGSLLYSALTWGTENHSIAITSIGICNTLVFTILGKHRAQFRRPGPNHVVTVTVVLLALTLVTVIISAPYLSVY